MKNTKELKHQSAKKKKTLKSDFFLENVAAKG